MHNKHRDKAWERVHGVRYSVGKGLYFASDFKCRFVHCSISSIRCVRCSFQLLLRSLFHFKSVVICCDPLNSHTRKRTRVVPTVSSQSFHRCSYITSRHKICSTCRQKLHKLAPEECVLTTSVECSILSAASISNVPDARLINAPDMQVQR